MPSCEPKRVLKCPSFHPCPSKNLCMHCWAVYESLCHICKTSIYWVLMGLETRGISTCAVHKAKSVIFSFLCYLRSVWQSQSTAPPSWRNQAVSRDLPLAAEWCWGSLKGCLDNPLLPTAACEACGALPRGLKTLEGRLWEDESE